MAKFNAAWLLRKRQFRSLTGVEPEIFREMVERLRPLWQKKVVAPKKKSGRPWGVGALEDHVLVLLILYRCGVTQDFLGCLYQVDKSAICHALQRIEPLARRVLGVKKTIRVEVILDWATAREYRKGENPARWRGHLENLLPRRAKVQKVAHRPALPYDRIGDFMAALNEQEGIAARAMAFCILTAARTSEAIGATWGEFDLNKNIWTVPASRIKAGREHRVPLSVDAVAILKQAQGQREASAEKKDDEKKAWVFTGQRQGKPLSNMAMLATLKRMNRTDITVHGFRSSFRDWCAEQTAFPREVAEAALAHISGDKVETAYLRSDFFDKRRQLMDAWARYCAMPSVKTGDKVVPMRRVKS